MMRMLRGSRDSRSLCLVICLLLGAASACTGSGDEGPPPKSAGTQAVETPAIQPRRILQEALEDLTRRDTGWVERRLSWSSVRVAWAHMSYDVSQRAFAGRVLLSDPDSFEPRFDGQMLVKGNRTMLASRQWAGPMRECWLRVPSGQRGRVQQGSGLTPIDVLHRVRAASYDEVSQTLEAQMPLQPSLYFLGQDAFPGFSGPSSSVGSVPVSITIADGVLLHWDLEGRQVLAAMGDRRSALSPAFRGFLRDAEAEFEFGEDSSVKIRVPSPGLVTSDPKIPCAGAPRSV